MSFLAASKWAFGLTDLLLFLIFIALVLIAWYISDIYTSVYNYANDTKRAKSVYWDEIKESLISINNRLQDANCNLS
ncbi:MAG: hypothetical protein JW745_06045 [Sedimentisphaerales bacterium]|nr:hypothetical protein [Sedimentisphaerales bacterium]MBN2841751.1 hypothetical protein [Sedimentisphaerales bacterium]